jgi:ABC-type sugar transport system substrate-binding protein
MGSESPELPEPAIRGVDRRTLIAGAAGAAAALAFPGKLYAYVNRQANSKEVAFAQPDTSFAGYPLLLHGAKQEASSRGYQLLESHANHQLDAQVNEINTWIGQKIGGIIVLPLDNNAMLPLIKKAHDNDVKFLDYSDKALPGTDGWVIFANLQGAHLGGTWLGQWINKNLGGKAEVALLTHEIQKTGRDRIHGSVAAMKKVAPGAKVVAQHEGVLAAECLTVAQSILQANPNLNAFICIADDGCLGAEKAFMQTHPSTDRQGQMAMIGYDGTVPVFEKIIAGSTIRATGALDLVAIGAASVRATINAIEGKQPTRINFPYVLASQSPAGLVVTKALLKKYKAITG